MSGSDRAEVTSTGTTKVLADFAAQLRCDDLPAAIMDTARRSSSRLSACGFDWRRHAVERLVARLYARTQSQGLSAGVVWERRLDPVSASFLNTVYAGSIDADDTHVGSMLHPGAIVFSAALAVCANASGGEFLAAVAAGYEAMIRIGLSIQPTHFRRGFQSTATCGGFGAAVAASRLLFAGKRDGGRRIAESIGLVASFSGGLTQFYQSGSTVKRIHAARAAENGVAAALLAAQRLFRAD